MIKVELKEKDFMTLLEAVGKARAFAKVMEDEENTIRYDDIHFFIKSKAEEQLGRDLNI